MGDEDAKPTFDETIAKQHIGLSNQTDVLFHRFNRSSECRCLQRKDRLTQDVPHEPAGAALSGC